MRLLLDTHVLLWWLADDNRLNDEARDAIGSADSEVSVSLASGWEIAIKIAIGKLQFPIAALARQVDDNHFRQLPIRLRHITATATLPFHHRDPFDRMLIAQALSEQLLLVTADARIERYDVPVLRA